MPRVIVARNEPRGDLEFIAYAKHIAECLADASFFPTPDPPLAVFNAHIADLDAAQRAAAHRGPGSPADRDAKRGVVLNDLRCERMYVQQLADALPMAEALDLIARSGFSAKKSSGHGKEQFAAQRGEVAGSVHLVARAEKTRTSYFWQYSKDGTTWTSLEDTVRADAWAYSLDVGVLYFFRYRVTTKAGASDWCQPVSLLVT